MRAGWAASCAGWARNDALSASGQGQIGTVSPMRSSRSSTSSRRGRPIAPRSGPVAPFSAPLRLIYTTHSPNSASTHAPSSRGWSADPTNPHVKHRDVSTTSTGPKQSILGRWYCPPRATTVGVVTNSVLTGRVEPNTVPVNPREGANNAQHGVWNDGDAAGGVRFRWVRVGVPMSAHSPARSTKQQAALSIPRRKQGVRTQPFHRRSLNVCCQSCTRPDSLGFENP